MKRFWLSFVVIGLLGGAPSGYAAAITVTATAIVPNSDAVTDSLMAGETIAAGQSLVKKVSDGKVYKADANDATLNGSNATTSIIVGIALNGGAVNQPISFIKGGSFTMNAGLTAGETYIVGATAAGDINPNADKASGWLIFRLGYATSTTVFVMDMKNTGVTL